MARQRYAELGGSRSGFTTAGVASVQVVQFNPQRRKLIIINDGANNVYLRKGDEVAIVGSGIMLTPAGAWTLEPDSMGYIWKGAVQCISLVGGQNICWTEDW